MKLSKLFENSPPMLRREALHLQQELIEAGWESELEFKMSNTELNCVVVRCRKIEEPSVGSKQNAIGYFIPEGSFHDVTGADTVRWEVNMVKTDIPGIIDWLTKAYA
jgi:hypothetical protein